MKKLTSSFKKKATNQWADAFPDLGVYKNMWLLRRVGPFLQGICLDMDSSGSNYLPTFHIHNLANQDDDFISLTLRTPLVSKKNGSPVRISATQHEEIFSDFIEQFRLQTPISLTGNISFENVWVAFQNYLKNGQAETRYPLNQYFDMTCLLIWCDRADEAKSFFYDKCKEIVGWPSSVTQHIGDRINKFYSLETLLEKPEDLRKKVDEVVISLNLERLPSVSLFI